MKSKYIITLLSVFLFWNYSYSQSSGSDIIICLDNSGSISDNAFNEMSASTRNIIQTVLRCNPKNRVSVVHYGTALVNGTPTSPKIYIESDFTNSQAVAQSFIRRLSSGDHFHEAVGLIGNALDNTPNPNILSPQTSLSTIPGKPLTVFLFTDANRSAGDITMGSYLVNFNSTAVSSNGAFHNFTHFKTQRNAKFVVVHVNGNTDDKNAAASISSLGGSYTGPLETYPADPESNQPPRLYLNKTNFILTGTELTNVTNEICSISNASLQFGFKLMDCESLHFPVMMGGNYTLPSGGSVTPASFQLSLVNTATNVSYPVNVVPTLVGSNQFQFVFNQSDMTNPPSGSYKLVVRMTYLFGSGSQTVFATNSNPLPFDMRYCCPNDLYITTPVLASNTDIQQASNSITATNVINSGATAVYHAGNFVSLKPGFNSKLGSDFFGYIEGCTGSDLKNEQSKDSYKVDLNAKPNGEALLITKTTSKGMVVTPNPTNGIFKTVLKEKASGLLQILDLNGKKVFENQFKHENEIPVNIQSVPQGNYIVRVTLENGNVITEKIIKR